MIPTETITHPWKIQPFEARFWQFKKKVFSTDISGFAVLTCSYSSVARNISENIVTDSLSPPELFQKEGIFLNNPLYLAFFYVVLREPEKPVETRTLPM